jgi:hypothetical protein
LFHVPIVATVVACLALAFPGVSFAQTDSAPSDSAPTILILEASKDGQRQRETLVRISGELRAAGFRVVFVERGDRAIREALTAALDAQGALAAISLEELDRARGVEVWVNDRATGKLSIRTLESSEAPAVLAVRAKELHRPNRRPRARSRRSLGTVKRAAYAQAYRPTSPS